MKKWQSKACQCRRQNADTDRRAGEAKVSRVVPVGMRQGVQSGTMQGCPGEDAEHVRPHGNVAREFLHVDGGMPLLCCTPEPFLGP